MPKTAEQSRKKATPRPKKAASARVAATAMHKFYLENIRCFKGRQEFHLRPLTFITGENSTGKSTVLGCLQVMSNMMSGPFSNLRGDPVSFNAEPYKMGTFSEIVTKSEPDFKQFRIGAELNYYGRLAECLVSFTERKGGPEPVVKNVKWLLKGGTELDIKSVAADTEDPWDEDRIEVKEKAKGKYIVRVRSSNALMNDPVYLLRWIMRFIRWGRDTNKGPRAELLAFLERNFGERPPLFRRRTQSIAPLRSKPQRSYEREEENENPQGGETPLTLMNMSESNPRDWERLRKQLVKFGEESGLFQDIQVSRLGDSKSNPFQMHVTVKGISANMMDVGYGVSQVLPILVRMMRRQDTTFLIQNPEVHLHHHAHAELTSLMAEVYQMRGNTFVVETQSDFMINRARIDIMNGVIKPEDVGLIYLEQSKDEKTKGATEVHNITFDENGNMINLPDGYRKFFSEENARLMGYLKKG